MEIEPLRWVTVHPALVHLPLGILPLSALAYVVAAARRSKSWTLVGDVALVTGALAAVAAGAFGFVSWFALEWPGGLDTWRWLHLGFGVASVTLALAAMGWRLRGDDALTVPDAARAGAIVGGA